jgi:septal ring-binding cell division protein DamX
VGNVTNPAPEHAAASERAAPSRRILASTSPPHHAAPDRTAETAEAAAASARPSGGHEERTSAPPPEEHYHNYARARRRGYNIVIDAAMDRAGANRMVSRLLALGYTPRIVPTRMNGQMWYKVQVGPYPTAEDARAAQTQLRAAYTARYVNRASAGGGSAANTDPAP